MKITITDIPVTPETPLPRKCELACDTLCFTAQTPEPGAFVYFPHSKKCGIYSQGQTYYLNNKEATALAERYFPQGLPVPKEFDQAAYTNEYVKNNIVQVMTKLSRKYDADIIEHLANISNKQDYIKRLIRADIMAQSALIATTD